MKPCMNCGETTRYRFCNKCADKRATKKANLHYEKFCMIEDPRNLLIILTGKQKTQESLFPDLSFNEAA